MKKIKNILAVILVALLAMSLIACEKTDSKGPESDKQEQKGKEEVKNDFPSQTITLICPYAAGGGTDVLLRSLSESASKIAGQKIVVDNVTGGNGITGVVKMMDSPADGYTIGSCSGEWVALKEVGLAPDNYDYNNCEQIMHYDFDPAAYLVRSDSKYQTLEDVIADAKARPGEIVLGVTAAGGSHHLTSILFQKEAGISLNVIPYSSGSAAAVTSVLNGQSEVCSVCPAEATPQIEAGQVRLLAVCSEKRLDSYPDVPTLKEMGYNVMYGAWRGLCAPKGTPEEVLNKLESIFYEAAQTQEFKDFCKQNHNEMDLLNRKEFTERYKAQIESIKEMCELYNEQQDK